ncbi:MAG: B3/4 domain-containing protein [Bacteroidota bacterium]
MIKISIEQELREKCPGMALGIIECQVYNSFHDEKLWEKIERSIKFTRENYQMDEVKLQTQIAATRLVYKACGKEPNRYRPSAEALYRRIIKNFNLYKVNTLVDLANLLSIKTGYSIGGFDASKIIGDIKAGIGKKKEPYEAIGRGTLNVEFLPILRDEKGGIGTPTSDEVRTAIDENTSQFLMNINGYTGKKDLPKAMKMAEELLIEHVNANNIKTRIIE